MAKTQRIVILGQNFGFKVGSSIQVMSIDSKEKLNLKVTGINKNGYDFPVKGKTSDGEKVQISRAQIPGRTAVYSMSNI